jgi:sensor domain CHASE-containing protein
MYIYLHIDEYLKNVKKEELRSPMKQKTNIVRFSTIMTALDMSIAVSFENHWFI